MKWSWKITRIADIDVFIHNTFLLLVLWFGYQAWETHGTLAAALDGMLYIVALFFCVVLHEFGHALTARRFGVVTKHITLLPIGGVAAMERMPERPLHEMLVAIAGPAVNIVIAGLLWLWLSVSDTTISTEELMTTGGPFAFRLMLVNVFLAIFNLLPAFPMDGGRVLRAGLATRLSHAQATQVASKIGQGFALIFGILGLFYNPFLLLIAIFLWFGASAENHMEQTKAAVQKITVEQAMLTEFHILQPHDTLETAVNYTLAGSQKDFPVGSPQHVTHLLTQKRLIIALHEHGSHIQLAELDLPNIPVVQADMPLQLLMQELNGLPETVLAVEKSQQLVGLINLDNIAELIQFNQAINGSRDF